MISTTIVPTLDLPTFPWTAEQLGSPLFKYGDFVCERYCHPTKRIPFKIIEVIRPKMSKAVYYRGYEYKLEAVFKEDQDAYLHKHEVPIPQCALIDFDEAKSDIIGALLSKAQDIKYLKEMH